MLKSYSLKILKSIYKSLFKLKYINNNSLLKAFYRLLKLNSFIKKFLIDKA